MEVTSGARGRFGYRGWRSSGSCLRVSRHVTSFCRTALGPCNIGFSSEVCAESLYVRIAWLDAS